MEWVPKFNEWGGERHHATTESGLKLNVFDSKGRQSHVRWNVYSPDGGTLLAEGEELTAEEAKQAAERAAKEVA